MDAGNIFKSVKWTLGHILPTWRARCAMFYFSFICWNASVDDTSLHVEPVEHPDSTLSCPLKGTPQGHIICLAIKKSQYVAFFFFFKNVPVRNAS